MRRAVVHPGDGFAVPMFGEAVPAQGSMFGAEAGCKAQEASEAGSGSGCPACGATTAHDCLGTAVALPDFEGVR